MVVLLVTNLYVISYLKAIKLAESTKLKLMSNLPVDHRMLSCYTLHSMWFNVCWRNWEKSAVKDKWTSRKHYNIWPKSVL